MRVRRFGVTDVPSQGGDGVAQRDLEQNYRVLRIVSSADMRSAVLGEGRMLDMQVGSRRDIDIRVGVALICFLQTSLDVRPGCRPNGAGASIFRFRRWSPRRRSAITRGTTVEQTPPIFPQFTGGNHDLFTLGDWEKREWSPL